MTSKCRPRGCTRAGVAKPQRTRFHVSNDTNKPPPERETEPELPVIPAGHAREALVHATARLAHAIGEYTSTAEAIARALDEQDNAIKAARTAMDATVLP